MSDDLFLITGGGTGAKVAEALVHLCAAGLGPRRVHLLVIDADSDNGNLKRALATAEDYQQLQRWPWSVSTTFGGRLGFGKKHASIDLFRTELSVCKVTEPIETTTDGARDLATAAADGDGLGRAIDLFYDPDEQEASNADGFRARPNLGCLLLADHLDRRLQNHSDAAPFLDAIRRAEGVVPIVVAASVFGGTGASLLPTARGVVERALRANEGADDLIARLRWSAAMVLPHYMPQRRLESVDPDRYLLDTANALQFYGTLQRAAEQAKDDGASVRWAFDALYLVGSEKPERNRVVPKLGREAQSNPGYLEEAVAAMAALDFARQPTGGQPVRVFHPGSSDSALGWSDLPLGTAEGGGLGAEGRVALLLHLAAFYLRPAHGHEAEYERGLAALLRQSDGDPQFLIREAWFKEMLDPWAEAVSDAYKNALPERRPLLLRDPNTLGANAADTLRPAAVGYFARLLLWAATAFRSSPDHPDLRLLDFSSEGNYARIYAAMSNRDAAELDRDAEGDTIQPADDNALVRALRTALAAFVAEHQSEKKITKLDPVALVEPDGRVRLKMTLDEVRSALREERLGDITTAFTSTVPETA